MRPVVVVVVLFGRVESRCVTDLRHDRIRIHARVVKLLDVLVGLLALLIVVSKDHRSVLSASICPLLIESRRVVRLEENCQQIVIRNNARVESEPDTFGVSGFPRADAFVRRVLGLSAGIAGLNLQDPVHFLKDSLSTPETPRAKCGR